MLAFGRLHNGAQEIARSSATQIVAVQIDVTNGRRRNEIAKKFARLVGQRTIAQAERQQIFIVVQAVAKLFAAVVAEASKNQKKFLIIWKKNIEIKNNK